MPIPLDQGLVTFLLRTVQGSKGKSVQPRLDKRSAATNLTEKNRQWRQAAKALESSAQLGDDSIQAGLGGSQGCDGGGVEM